MGRWISYLGIPGSAGTGVLLLVIGFTCGGCATTGPRPSRDPAVADARPILADARRGRSLAFDGTPPALAADARGAGELRWYDLRNDVGPAVFGGYDSVTVSTVHTLSRNGSYVYDGRVRDHSADRTVRESVHISVR